MVKHILSILLLVSASIQAATSISGDIGGQTFSTDGNPYIVTSDIKISSGKQATFNQGCIVLFEAFTGIKIEGAFFVKGTSENPVIFTSINNKFYNKSSTELTTPFDWNGVHIARNASTVVLENFRIEYSVYGIKSERENITIKNMVANSNGQFHFTINEAIQFVQDGYPFSYSLTPDKPAQNQSESKPSRITATAPKVQSERTWHAPVAITTGVIGIASASAGVFFGSKMSAEDKLAISKSITQKEAEEHKTRGNTYYTQSVASYVASGILIPAAIALYIFKPNNKHNYSFNIKANYLSMSSLQISWLY